VLGLDYAECSCGVLPSAVSVVVVQLALGVDALDAQAVFLTE
jgi:hypothetical protein